MWKSPRRAITPGSSGIDPHPPRRRAKTRRLRATPFHTELPFERSELPFFCSRRSPLALPFCGAAAPHPAWGSSPQTSAGSADHGMSYSSYLSYRSYLRPRFRRWSAFRAGVASAPLHGRSRSALTTGGLRFAPASLTPSCGGPSSRPPLGASPGRLKNSREDRLIKGGFEVIL